MNEAKQAKPFASLSSGLLARKGTAKPAMRPQGFGSYGAGLEDLGWNDMGHGVYEPVPGDHVPSSIAALTPAPGGRGQHEHYAEEQENEEFESYEPPLGQVIPEPPVVEQRRVLEASFEAPVEDYEGEEEQADELQPELRVDAEPEPEQQAELEPRAELEPEVGREPEIEHQAEFEPAPQPMAIPAPVVRLPKRKAIVAAAPVSAPALAPASIPAREKAAFTLRLDPGRHLRLRLACAVTRRSAQQIVTGALDEYLASLPELDTLAEHVPAQAGKRRR